MLRNIFFVLTISIVLMSIGCVKRVDRQGKSDYGRYFPLNSGDEYYFSNRAFKAEVTNSIGNLFTFTYYDSSGNILWWEDYLKVESGVKWNNIVFNIAEVPSITFEPPLPFSPWSDLIGDTLVFPAVEIRSDSVNSHFGVAVTYKVMDIEDITTPAGIFKRCIKIRRDYKTSDRANVKMLDGRSIWWFAKDVGCVKYEAAEVSFELVRATINKVNFPK